MRRRCRRRPTRGQLRSLEMLRRMLRESWVALVTDPQTPEKVRLEAAEAILHRLARAEMLGEINADYGGEEVTFEQVLKMTKRSMDVVDKGNEAVTGE